MTDALKHGAFTAQPTCCLRQRPRITGPRLCSLEISHVHRLRRKLTAAGSDTQIESVWGIGYRLHPPELNRDLTG